LKKILSTITAAALSVLMLTSCGGGGTSPAVTETTTTEVTTVTEPAMREMTTQQIVDDMGIGINLGNTYESVVNLGHATVEDYMTAWGSPVVTEPLIQGYADAGFGVVRIPVAWSNMMSNDGTYTIDQTYIDSVKRTVDWTIGAGMYAIVNIHWDGGWWDNFANEKKRQYAFDKYTRVWEQLSEAFKDYDDHLMFESLNEEGGWDEIWNRYDQSDIENKQKSYDLLNQINQLFVDIVRKSGGNNEKRHLLIAGYCTDIDRTVDPLFKMPNDPANHCAVSVHYYNPPTFAILETDASWGKASATWGTDAEYAELERYLDLLKTTFVDKGVPVIIGEYGCPVKSKDPESVVKYLTAVCYESYTRNICPVLWDITDAQYDRTTFKMKTPELEANFKAIKEGTYTK
jgi:endoglucanase